MVLIRQLLPEAFLSWNSWISKNCENVMKNLNNFMSSCPIWIIFGSHDSAWCTLPFIPHIHLDPTIPSWSVGQLKSLKSAKKAKMQWKTSITSWVFVRSGYFLSCIVALDVLYHSSHIFVLIRWLLPEALVSWNPQNQQKSENAMKNLNKLMSSCPIWIIFCSQNKAWCALSFIPHIRLDQTTPSWSVGQLKSSKSAKKAKIQWKTSIISWVLDRFGRFLICNVALDVLYNSSHTFVLNQPLLPKAFVSWNPLISKKQRKHNENLNNFMSSGPIWMIFDL